MSGLTLQLGTALKRRARDPPSSREEVSISAPTHQSSVLGATRPGTGVKQLVSTFASADPAIHRWLMQDRINRGEAEGDKPEQPSRTPNTRPTLRDRAGGSRKR